MKIVGIIGGIGPASSIEYYRQIFATCRKQRPYGSPPSIIINSIDVKKLIDLVAAKKMQGLRWRSFTEVSACDVMSRK